jgi:hypothetical protein
MATGIHVRPGKGEESFDRIGWMGPTIGSGMIVASVVLFNVFPQKVGYYGTVVDPDSFVPLLGLGFGAFLPVLNLWWALAFGLEVINLVLGCWTIPTRWARLSLDAFLAAILFAMASAEPFIHLPVATFLAKAVLILTGMALCAGVLTQFVKLVQRLVERTQPDG